MELRFSFTFYYKKLGNRIPFQKEEPKYSLRPECPKSNLSLSDFKQTGTNI